MQRKYRFTCFYEKHEGNMTIPVQTTSHSDWAVIALILLYLQYIRGKEDM